MAGGCNACMVISSKESDFHLKIQPCTRPQITRQYKLNNIFICIGFTLGIKPR